METFEQKCERNRRVQDRYDELMREGKHGHYETMFRVVREEVELSRASLSAPDATTVAPAEPDSCTLCNALIVPRNPTHYDQADLNAAKVRAKLIAATLNSSETPNGSPAEPVGYIDRKDLARLHTYKGTVWPGPTEIDAVPVFLQPGQSNAEPVLGRCKRIDSPPGKPDLHQWTGSDWVPVGWSVEARRYCETL